jgi:ABC-2 type transport system permease protein
MSGLLAYLWLEAKRQWRNREILLFRLGIPVSVYLILIAAQDQPEEAGGLPGQTGRMVALAALGAVISGLASGPSLGEDRGNGWLRQLRVAAAGGLLDDVTLGWWQWAGLVVGMWLATAPLTALGALIGLGFSAEAAHGATTLAFVVLWLGGGIFTSPDNLPDTLAAISKTLPSWGVVQVGESVAGGHSLPASALVVLAAWTLGAGALAALAWRRVLAR